MTRCSGVAVGIGYRRALDRWVRDNLRHFDVLEITVDHCLSGNAAAAAAIYDLVECLPLTAHGVGLSIGTAAPLDLVYLDRVATVVDRLRAPAYSEHLAFTRVPGRDLANLLPLPKTERTAAMVIDKVQRVQDHLPVPFLLENIAYLFDWPDSTLSDAEFFALICGETGAGMLLDIENLYVNAHNHRFDPYEFLDAVPAQIVKEMHMAGGIAIHGDLPARPLLADSHSHPVPGGAFELLDYALARYAPASVILERDERLDATDELLDDVARIRAHLARAARKTPMRKRLLARQTELLEYLTSDAAIFGDTRAPARRPDGFDRRLLDLEARLSHEKRLAKIRPVFARTFEILGTSAETLVREFADAYPPTTISVLENARQFHCFLSARWGREPPARRHLPDVAACELVMAEVRAAGRPTRDASPKVDPRRWANCSIRRAPGVRLLRCAFTIRPIFEPTLTATVPEPRDTPLAIVMPADGDHPQIFEVPVFVFELLAALDDFAHSAALGASSGLPRLLGELAEHELIEIRP